MTSLTAIIRTPSPRLSEGLVTHIERKPVDMTLAMQQWDAYVGTLHAEGWTTITADPADNCPDSVFVEDAVVVYQNVAVVTRPGAVERGGETAAILDIVTRLGYDVHAIRAPGTLDGGDVLKIEDTIYVGQGGRTNEEGIAQLRAALSPAGATVVSVPTTLVLHLKSAVTALPDGTVIGYPPLVDNPSKFPTFLAVPEESGAHVVLLGENRLLMAASCPQTHTQFRGLGYEPVIVDISEYEKLEGCVTCLSVRLRDLPQSVSRS